MCERARLMSLLQLRNASLIFGTTHILDQVGFTIERGERVCLLGRNGTGKTTFLRVISGEESLKSGEVIRPNTTVLTRLPQDVPTDVVGTVREVIHSGISPQRHEEEWEIDWRLDQLAEDMSLDGDVLFSSLSGGLKRRVLLARALAAAPDVLLLDEPTNHLDLDSILWLENFLVAQPTALFFVTHDRAFLRKLATRIVELDRGKLTSWDCDYESFLVRKAAALEAEEKQWSAFDKKLALEEAWLRQGVKARRTRNEGRVHALHKLRTERSKRREREGSARLGMQDANVSGQKVLEAKNVAFAYESRPILRDFTATIWRGDKVGIIGPNGGGKTTLLKLLLGELTPTSGLLVQGTNLQIVYLDQLRDLIEDEKTLAWNVAGESEYVTYEGRSRHIHGYLRDFLFSPERARQPAKFLSGGERNRLLLARLFLKPANLLVLDEPTNDLDAETLELLEDLLVRYTGTMLLVSHDREFLDNVVTSSLVFEEEGIVREYVGGYSDWVRQKQSIPTTRVASLPTAKLAKKEKPRKLLNREQSELDSLPANIEALEAEQATLDERLADPETYIVSPKEILLLQAELAALHTRLATSYARWEELEAVRLAATTQGDTV